MVLGARSLTLVGIPAAAPLGMKGTETYSVLVIVSSR